MKRGAIIVAFFAAIAVAPLHASEPELSLRRGDVWLGSAASVPVRLTRVGHVTEAKLSPDGHLLAFIHRDKPADSEFYPSYDSLWLEDVMPNAKPHKVVSWSEAQKPEDELMGFASLHWSLDGRYIYFLSSAWATSRAIHQFDTKTDRQVFVTNAEDLRIVQNGPYRGKFLISRHTCHPTPGCDFPTSIVDLGGNILVTIPNSNDPSSDAVSRWLTARHWAAR